MQFRVIRGRSTHKNGHARWFCRRDPAVGGEALEGVEVAQHVAPRAHELKVLALLMGQGNGGA